MVLPAGQFLSKRELPYDLAFPLLGVPQRTAYRDPGPTLFTSKYLSLDG